MVAIHQVLPVFAPRDAIGNHTAAVRRVLHGMGITSEVVAGEVNPGAPCPARTTREVNPAKLAAAEPTIWMYHASTGTPVADWFADLPGPKAIDYHNISPAEILGPWEPHIGIELEHGRRQLADLAGVCDWALADSSFNEAELRGLGYRWTAVVPILLDTAHLADEGVDADVLARLTRRKEGTEWLFVSRILPHKAQHDVIKAFAAYRQAYDKAAHLSLVGAVGSARYFDALAAFVDELELTDAVELTGSVSPGELGARFRVADVYVSASDHEGFGVPLLEAMAHDVPVVAYASSAIPETVDDAALLVADKSPTTLAAAVHRVVDDAGLRAELVASGRRRLDELGLPASTARLREAVEAMVTELRGR
jgi:glycosyltransferase involved in cell wall biosynthesis